MKMRKLKSKGIKNSVVYIRGAKYVPLILLLLFTVSGCNNREEKLMTQKVLLTEPNTAKAEELSKEIAALLEETKRTIRATEKLGTYYRMLAMEYLDRNMYGPALENFRLAINIYPANPILSYYAGVCTGMMAKTEFREKERQTLFEEAEKAYLYSLNLRPGYEDALYALSVLYIFEMDRPLAAEPHLRTLLAINKNNVQALFLMARVMILSGRIEEAVAHYDSIIKADPDTETVNSARRNRQAVMEGEYGR